MPPGKIGSMSPDRQQRLALVGLLTVAAIWGSSFPVTKVLFEQIPAMDLLAVRFLLAAVVTGAIFHRHLRRLTRRGWVTGGVLGVLYAAAQSGWMLGLERISPAVSGFVIGLYVVFTPLVAWLMLGTRISRKAWIGAFVSLAGLALLALRGFSIGTGELISVGAAAVFGVHIVLLGHWSKASEAIGLSVVQLFSCGLTCMAVAAPDGLELPGDARGWLLIAYLAVVSGALAMVVQTWSQAHLPANRAAIAMSMEPVFATIWSIVLIDESVTWRLLAGGSLMLTGMLIVELRPRRRGEPPAPEELPHVAAP